MAIRSGFFNSVNGDRVYKAEDFTEYFATFIGNGIFPTPTDGLKVIPGDGMSVNLNVGKAWINGGYMFNDDNYNLQIDVADGVLHRIDRIVVQLNFINREIVPVVKRGNPSSSPVAPALQRDGDIYELALADVYVSAGAISITESDITDHRNNDELCGIVKSLVDGAVEEMERQLNELSLSFNEHLAEKAKPNGYASLDETGNVPASQLSNVPEGAKSNAGTYTGNNASSRNISVGFAPKLVYVSKLNANSGDMDAAVISGHSGAATSIGQNLYIPGNIGGVEVTGSGFRVRYQKAGNGTESGYNISGNTYGWVAIG